MDAFFILYELMKIGGKKIPDPLSFLHTYLRD